MIKNKARLEILHFVMTFCTKDEMDIKGICGFQMDHVFKTNRHPPVGALVKLLAAPPTKWYLGWYVEYIPATENQWEQHVIESIEDGSLCRWRNVSLAHLPMKLIDEHPSWRWTDQQFIFKNKLIKANQQSENSYVFRVWPIFKNDNVEIPLRRRHLGDPEHKEEIVVTITMEPKKWKKASIKSLVTLLDIHIKKELKRKI